MLLGAVGKGKYALSVGTKQDNSPYSSALFSQFLSGGQASLPIFNNLAYQQQQIYQISSYTQDYRKWRITLAYSASYLYQRLAQEKNTQKQDNYIIEPSLSVRYTLTRYAFLTARTGYNQIPLGQNYLFENEVLINNRTTISHTPNLSLQNSFSNSLFYLNNNLDKFFKLNLGVAYQKSTGNFFTNWTIQERTTQINSFFLPAPTDNLNFNFSANKLVASLNLDVAMNSNYSILNYKNILNNSELRDNQNRNFNGDIALKTTFDIPINFHNTVSYAQNQSRNAQSGVFKNEYFTNASKILIKPSQSWFMSLTSEYYIPNLRKSAENYWFLDAMIRFSPAEKRYEFHALVQNILNKKSFKQVQTNDFATTIFESNLLPRYFMLVFSYNF